jgi:hypothetical protein
MKADSDNFPLARSRSDRARGFHWLSRRGLILAAQAQRERGAMASAGVFSRLDAHSINPDGPGTSRSRSREGCSEPSDEKRGRERLTKCAVLARARRAIRISTLRAGNERKAQTPRAGHCASRRARGRTSTTRDATLERSSRRPRPFGNPRRIARERPRQGDGRRDNRRKGIGRASPFRGGEDERGSGTCPR